MGSTNRKGKKKFEFTPVALTDGLYKIHVMMYSKLVEVHEKK